MIEMEKPKIECLEISDDGRYGKFVVDPLERGFGITRQPLDNLQNAGLIYGQIIYNIQCEPMYGG